MSSEVVLLDTDVLSAIMRGQLIGDADILIAATALTHGLVLVTNNHAHYNRIGALTVRNWL